MTQFAALQPWGSGVQGKSRQMAWETPARNWLSLQIHEKLRYYERQSPTPVLHSAVALAEDVSPKLFLLVSALSPSHSAPSSCLITIALPGDTGTWESQGEECLLSSSSSSPGLPAGREELGALAGLGNMVTR